jgi:outer membrane protein assembly factor BamB
MSRRIILACIFVVSAGLPARAQVPFARDLLPTRTALTRLGLERQWMAVVPLVNDERVMSVSMGGDLIFAQTSRANFHAFQAETGQHLWSAILGNQTGRSLPASVNSFAVFVTNMNQLFALDRRTGKGIWVHELGTLPSSPTTCDEERVLIGRNDGKIYSYDLTYKDGNTKRISDRPIAVWNWQTGGVIETRPLAAGKFVAFGSDDGKVYVSLSDERTMLYRLATGAPIGAGLGTFGTRLLLVPSEDRNLYAMDLFTGDVRWSFPAGAPITQEPMVAGNDVYVVNSAGQLSLLEPNTGSARWTSSTQGGRLLSIGAKRIYLESHDEDLFVIDRATGQIVADPRATFERIGLNLRPYEFGLTNRQNDRLYFATASGLILALREVGQTTPRLLRDPKALPFGTIPKEGVSPTPPLAPPAEPAPAPGEEKPAPAEEKEKPPAEEKEKPPAPAEAVPAPAAAGEAPK